MRSNTKRAGAVMVAALLTAGLTSGAAVGAVPDSGGSSTAGQAFGARAAQAERGSSVVTLITGDQVHLDPAGQVTRIQRAKGREGIRIAVNRVAGDVYVLPADVSDLIGRGELDRRLFNVSGLIRAEYDDAHRETLPLIVSYTKDKARAKAAIEDADVSVRRNLPAVGGEALTAPKTDTAEVWEALTSEGGQGTEARTAAPGIARVWLDGVRKAALDKSVPQIGAPTAWGAGYDGKGVKVAVLDTGVDQTHPDLKGVEITQKDFSGSGNTVDHIGHGTHVASTVAGSGAKSGGKFKGVAPGAKILDGKVLDDTGFGEDSGIIAGMQWAADQGAKIANLSLGGEDTAENDPLETAVNRLSAQKDILFVIAAGNEGPGVSTIGSPGSAASALTVGAVDRKDGIADFSSIGPTADGSLKPDITAPGVDIVAAKAAQGSLGSPAGAGYVSMSGTSMATPHVAGAAAILAQRHPDWTGKRIKQVLTASAKSGAGLTAYQQGAGRADVARAITQTVVSEQTSVNFGLQRWPHTNAKPITKRVTYSNSGTEPVTLDLSLETAGPTGKAAPAGFFTTSANQVTVPAGGTAGVTLTANTSIGGVDGGFSGAVVARATEGGQSVRTSFGVVREKESYDVTLKFVNAKGKPSPAMAMVIGHTNDVWKNANGNAKDGVAKIRLEKGSYLVDAPIMTSQGSRGEDLALMVQPQLSVTKNTTVVFDARKAKPVSITAPDSAKVVETYTGYALNTPAGGFTAGWSLESFKGVSLGQVGAAVPASKFDAQVGGTWQKGSTSYNLLYNRAGSQYTGFTRKAAKGELAQVNLKIGSSAKSRKGSVNPYWSKNNLTGGGTYTKGFALPGAVKAYVTTPKGFKWAFNVGQGSSTDEWSDLELYGGFRAYQAKKVYTHTYNVGVFSPRIDGNSN
ncbi:S8 family peptidase, partial [Streptomyces sp. NPDC087850]|uniref:S8 family peptidase n=1 Tax=Streptomyces sp. NPDC087850 TaxID=3365809 RepID=UPI0038105671